MNASKLKPKFHVISTNFHEKGLVSSHRTHELAEKAMAKRLKGTACDCGCYKVFTTHAALELPRPSTDILLGDCSLYQVDDDKIFNPFKNIKVFVSMVRCAELEGIPLQILWGENGEWSGDHCSGYSASDRQRNGDYVYDELSEKAQERAMNIVKEGCKRLNKMTVNFGRNKLFYRDREWSDFIRID